MEMSFFALPSKQGPVQGRFKPAHRPISLSAKAAACVRRFETTTPLSYARTESKKDISMLFIAFLSCITLKRSAGVTCLNDTRYLNTTGQLTHLFAHHLFRLIQCIIDRRQDKVL